MYRAVGGCNYARAIRECVVCIILCIVKKEQTSMALCTIMPGSSNMEPKGFQREPTSDPKGPTWNQKR